MADLHLPLLISYPLNQKFIASKDVKLRLHVRLGIQATLHLLCYY